MSFLQTLFDYSPIGYLYNFITSSISSLITDFKNGLIDLLTSWYAIIIYICVFLFGVYKIWAWRRAQRIAAEEAKKEEEELAQEEDDEKNNQSPGMDFAAAEAIVLNKMKQEQTDKDLIKQNEQLKIAETTNEEQNQKLQKNEEDTNALKAELNKIKQFLILMNQKKKRQ